MTTLFDTGPLVAPIDRSDKHHARCTALLESLEGPLLIPTTVVVEVCWLVEERPDVEAAFLESVGTREFQHVPSPPPIWRGWPSSCAPMPACRWARSMRRSLRWRNG